MRIVVETKRIMDLYEGTDDDLSGSVVVECGILEEEEDLILLAWSFNENVGSDDDEGAPVSDG
jgi:hypothetical protein